MPHLRRRADAARAGEAISAPVTRDGLAEAIGLAASGGTFAAYLSRLSSAGLLEKSAAGVRAAPALMEAM